MQCVFCGNKKFRENRIKCQICNRCELIHASQTHIPLGWAIFIGGISGGIVPYDLVLPHVDRRSPIDVASVLCLAAQIGLTGPSTFRKLQEVEDALFPKSLTVH